MTRLALLLICWLAVRPGTAQQLDSVIARIERQGFYVYSDRLAAPFSAVPKIPGGGVAFGPDVPVYYFARDGQMLPGSPYQYYSGDFERWRGYHHRAFACRDNHFGVINSQGQVVVPFRFEDIEPIWHPSGWLKVKQAGLWGVIDSVGRFLVPPRYQEIGTFSDGLLAVKLHDRWGFIDTSGREVIAPQYLCVWEGGFHQGFAAVTLAEAPGRVGFVNKHNHSYTGFGYEHPYCVNRYNAHILDRTPYYQFGHGYALVRNQNCEVGAIDTLGRVLLPTRFYSIRTTDSTLTGCRRKQRVLVKLPYQLVVSQKQEK